MVADRFQGVSPADVDEWPAQMVADALARMEAEAEWQREQAAKRKQRDAATARGGATLGDEFPDMEE